MSVNFDSLLAPAGINPVATRDLAAPTDAQALLRAAQPDSIGSSRGIPQTDMLRQLSRLAPALSSHSAPSTTHAPSVAKLPDAVAGMTLSEKVATTVKSGIATAAKDTGSEVGTFLKDPKNQAMLAGGTAAFVGAQFVPGLDVAVDGTLGVAGAATYLAAAPQHT